ncbi:thiamine pyrophosphate-requiring protein [Novosphingobium sp. KACC 22771]|uniref:thiamine pyrophosphate-requiring protein n=1 Tax=Novosphingobium sp. KACC 22771 TaxID=3025670 RepID=UPI002365EBEF|nr:thiamine pyrophosphate-requiring protein [Novosphingobium sp. KACC 22771]WDF75040.1 thiamine pyrophosphate-requiring protein [Novosphingobium sp. KACC 22771]
MKVGTAIARILKIEGVDVLFGYPRNAVLEAAAKEDIRTIIVRQERTGLHMADAYSRMTRGGKMGVFAMQHGPGTENAYGGVAQAFSESVPVLVLPQGYARALAHVPDNYNACRSMRDITKTAEPILRAQDTPAILRRAFTALRNGRRRPALVEMPWDVLTEDVGDTLDYVPVVSTRYGPDPAQVAAVAQRLVAAPRLVIHAGQGVHWANAYTELRELAELLAAPVSTSLEGKSAFDETHPLALGSGGAAIPGQLRHFLDSADLIFGIGCSFAQTAFGVAMPGHVPIIHATLDPADINKGVPCEAALIGDAQLTLAMLLAEVRKLVPSPRDMTPVADEIARVEQAWLAQWLPLLESGDAPISPYRVLWELQRTVDVAGTIITHDAGSPRDQLTPFWKSITPLSYIGWGKSTQLGYGLGLAMGAKLACPDRLCINVWGDAAIGFTGMDFETAVRERLPILSILLNNSAMAIELDQMPVATERYHATAISGHYADFARALGGYGERITDPAQIGDAIRRGIAATQAGQPALLEFMTAKETRASRL